ncbi:hypothetical protein NT06LI_0662, partial [Listeria innocua FSL J1-023]
MPSSLVSFVSFLSADVLLPQPAINSTAHNAINNLKIFF